MRGPLAILLTTVTVAVLPAQAPSAPPAGGHRVHLDVFAADARGRAVDDLKPAEFELREEGATQTLDAVRLVRDEPRLFAIFLDEYHVAAGADTDRARDAIARFVDNELATNDRVVVMKPLDSIFAIRFTTDRDTVRQAIQSFAGRKGEYAPQNAYERNYIAGTPARIEAARTQVAWSAINALAIHMGGLAAGRKTLIVVSEAMATPERSRGQEFLPTRDTTVRSANRANVAIYHVNPGSAAAGATADALDTAAMESDGASINDDLDGGLHRAAADATRYYLLSYTSARPDDGRFHELQVRVTRPGIRLRARRGFVAAAPDEALRATLLAHANDPKPAAPAEPAPHASPLIRPWFGISRGSTGKLRITFVWEPATRVPGDRSPAIKGSPARLTLTARGADGSVLFEGPVAATGPAVIDEPGATPARAVFDAPPGRLRLRMSIEDVTARPLDTDVRDIAIREIKGAVALGTPEILRARNAREFRSLETSSAVPVAAREFSRTERLLIRFAAYAPPGTQPTLSARLLSRMGQPMRDLAVAAAGEPGADNAIDLPLASLAAGEYMVEVAATSPAGDAKDRISFRVTP